MKARTIVFGLGLAAVIAGCGTGVRPNSVLRMIIVSSRFSFVGSVSLGPLIFASSACSILSKFIAVSCAFAVCVS